MACFIELRRAAWLTATAMLAALGAGCSSERAGPEGGVRQRFPEQAAQVVEGREAFVVTADGFHLRALPSEGTWRGVSITVPKDAREPIRLRTQSGFEARVRELGASGETSLDENAATYARTGGRSYWASAPGGTEEWLLLDAGVVKPGQAAAAWEVDGGRLRKTGDVVEVADGSGVPRLRVSAPRAYAAGGRPVNAKLAVDGKKIELFVDADGEEVLVDPVWVPAASMAYARYFHTATLLGNGNVLVSGGYNDTDGVLSTAEIYDPAADSWTLAGTMSNPRYIHTATLLQNGKVLVTGGVDFAGITATSELYDPSTNSWSSAPSLAINRYWHTATRLANGSVFVSGGFGNTGALGNSETYDAVAATRVTSTSMPINTGRYGHTANLLGNGNVVFIGGFGNSGHVAATTLYNPTTNAWSTVAPLAAGQERYAHAATLLQTGNVLVTGGLGVAGDLSSALIYNAATSSWVTVPSMTNARAYHSATLLASGQVLVSGGGNAAASTEIYDPATSTWAAAASMTDDRAGHTETLLANGQVLVSGGFGGIGYLNSAELFTSAPVSNNGTACITGATCTSGFCVDGVCCNSACGGTNNDCQACSVAAGAAVDGTCGPTNGNACDDGNACTLSDVCQTGTCVGSTPATCAPPDQCHTAGTCNPLTGGCDYPNKPDNTPCDDGVACTLGDACLDGACVPTSPGGCTPEDIGIDIPSWGSGVQPCTNNAPCDDGGIGPATPDPQGVYESELRPFLLNGSFSIAECGAGLRPFTTGAVRVKNTNLTAYDLGGNDFGGNSLVENSPGWYGHMLQRNLQTPSGLVYLNYAVYQATWDYQGSKALTLSLPGSLLPTNTFTAPPTGNHTINLDKTNLVSVRYEVTSTTPCIGISALRFGASATDGKASGSFASGSAVAGTFSGSTLSPDPGTTGGFVRATNPSAQVVATGEMLLEAGHLYRVAGAVELSDPFGAPLNVVGIPQTSISIPPGQCAPMVIQVSVALPKGGFQGQMSFSNTAPSVDPTAITYHASYIGTNNQNVNNGQRAGYNINGSAKTLPSSGAPVNYLYQAVVEGRYGALWPTTSTVQVKWPATSPFGSAGLGVVTWPTPGTDLSNNPYAVTPINTTSAFTGGLYRDGFVYVDDNDPIVGPNPAWPPQCPQDVFHTETINFSAPMAFVGGSIQLTGCGQVGITGGTAGFSGTGACVSFPTSTFVDEQGFTRTTRVLTSGGWARGVINNAGAYEAAALKGLWQDGGKTLTLSGAPVVAGAPNYNGEIGVWRVFTNRPVYDLQPGRANITAAGLQQLQTTRVATRLTVKNEDSSLRPFRNPQAYVGQYDYTDGNNNVLGGYYSSSVGLNVKQPQHIIEIVRISNSVGNVRYQAIVPENPDGTGREFWVSIPMLENIATAPCAPVAPTCIDIQRGLPNSVVEDALIRNGAPNLSTNYGASCSLTANASPSPDPTSRRALVQFDLSQIPVGATVTTATITLAKLVAAPADAPVNVYQVLQPWSESTVTWNSLGGCLSPGCAATPALSTIAPGGTSATLNVTSVAQGWVNAPATNHGVLLERQSSGMTVFGGSECAQNQRPHLHICYIP